MLAHSPAKPTAPFPHRVKVATGGAAPPSAVIAAMEALGVDVVHLYGLTETFGPEAVATPQPDWPHLQVLERVQAIARQGVRHPTMAEMLVAAAGAIDAATLVAWCKTKMAGFKVPRAIVFGELPKTATGKIQKYVLRAQARALDQAEGQ